jgi:hypothetical protein
MVHLEVKALEVIQKAVNTLNAQIEACEVSLKGAMLPVARQKVLTRRMQFKQFLSGYQQCYTDILNSDDNK